MFVGDPLTNVYLYHEPTIDFRETYCEKTALDIINININGVAVSSWLSLSDSVYVSSIVDSSKV